MDEQNRERSENQNEPGMYGDEYLVWEVLERPKYERGRLWYLIAIAVAVGLLIYAVATANFLFALIIIMFALILYLSSVVDPRTVRVALTQAGVTVGERFHRYRDISRFWVVYQPPEVKTLYLDLKSGFNSCMPVHLGDVNPNQVRQILAHFVREDLDEDDEPVSDFIGRILKI
jgi:type IV secretory pathway VirB3-like protein